MGLRRDFDASVKMKEESVGGRQRRPFPLVIKTTRQNSGKREKEAAALLREVIRPHPNATFVWVEGVHSSCACVDNDFSVSICCFFGDTL